MKMNKIFRLNVKPEQEKKVYLSILAIALVACWLIYDFVLVQTKVFRIAEEYTFGVKTSLQIKDKIKQEVKRFQSSNDLRNQITALVHMLESNYFLLYNRQRSMSRYYDFIKVVLFPPQRKQLKNKSSYIRHARRYLKRKRNLEINFTGYRISEPRISREVEGTGFEVLIRRFFETTSGKQGEYFVYHFKKHTDKRYYLYFTDVGSDYVRYKFLENKKKENNLHDNEYK
jgi:hypothetical protein